LEPFGVAYNRGAAANGYQSYQGSTLNRRPSRISEKTTPDTSIAIDVVPPVSIIFLNEVKSIINVVLLPFSKKTVWHGA
jgi:hypothetical protein